ncbi:MAG: chemotaxis response regulator protein-glutamate methylesterase [Cellvibrionaceae bacterium]|nr:chemotaxis response regulator protein-glutamate methylesterase [Cellvibrionaceae bacterium]
MPYTVLIVDDSSFFQTRLKELIGGHSELDVIGIATNGREAIEKEESLRPNIITMDYEMPFLDGLSAVRAITAKRSVPIVMFSSLTYEGAKITLEALEAGAVDFIPKNFAEVSRNSESLRNRLHKKLISFARNSRSIDPAIQSLKTDELAQQALARSLKAKQTTLALRQGLLEKKVRGLDQNTPQKIAGGSRRKLGSTVKTIVIGASTGGPVALSELIPKLPKNLSVPILVVQHMPENFTRAFAERLNRISQLTVKQAETGDTLAGGQVFIAPGGKQLIFDKSGHSLKVIDGDDRVSFKPCVDVTFTSAANVFGGKVLGIVMTGMGNDGCAGSRILKQKGAYVWGQDRETSVIYGMPAAVANANLADEILPVSGFISRIIEEF